MNKDVIYKTCNNLNKNADESDYKVYMGENYQYYRKCVKDFKQLFNISAFLLTLPWLIYRGFLKTGLTYFLYLLSGILFTVSFKISGHGNKFIVIGFITCSLLFSYYWGRSGNNKYISKFNKWIESKHDTQNFSQKKQLLIAILLPSILLLTVLTYSISFNIVNKKYQNFLTYPTDWQAPEYNDQRWLEVENKLLMTIQSFDNKPYLYYWNYKNNTHKRTLLPELEDLEASIYPYMFTQIHEGKIYTEYKKKLKGTFPPYIGQIEDGNIQKMHNLMEWLEFNHLIFDNDEVDFVNSRGLIYNKEFDINYYRDNKYNFIYQCNEKQSIVSTNNATYLIDRSSNKKIIIENRKRDYQYWVRRINNEFFLILDTFSRKHFLVNLNENIAPEIRIKTIVFFENNCKFINGKIYILGRRYDKFNKLIGSDLVYIDCFSEDGTLLWRKRYPQIKNSDFVRFIDNSNDLLIHGKWNDGNKNKPYIFKIDEDGNLKELLD